MAKRVHIIGNCSCCHREIDSDGRPITQMTLQEFLEASNDDGESAVSNVSLTSRASDELTAASATSMPTSNSTATIQSEQPMRMSGDNLTETVLGMVREQFQLPPESHIPDDHAQFVMSLLGEEQRGYSDYLAAKNQAAQKKRRKN